MSDAMDPRFRDLSEGILDTLVPSTVHVRQARSVAACCVRVYTARMGESFNEMRIAHLISYLWDTVGHWGGRGGGGRGGKGTPEGRRSLPLPRAVVFSSRVKRISGIRAIGARAATIGR